MRSIGSVIYVGVQRSCLSSVLTFKLLIRVNKKSLRSQGFDAEEFSSVVAVREAAKAYDVNHNIALTTAYSSSSRIKLICKHSGGNLAVYSCEAQHNLAAEENSRAYAMHCKLSPEVMDIVSKYPEENDDVVTVFNILKRSEYTNIIFQDIANIKKHFGKSGEGREIFEFITTLQDLDFHERYIVDNTEDNKVNKVFFVHKDAIEEAIGIPETAIIGATYKTNSHSMIFVNIVGTSVFITDNEQALRNALTHAFPKSKQFLCYKHIKDNFKKQLFPVMKEDENEEKKSFLEKLAN
ncbi:hypothetical protein PHYBLDRAFT_60246 [Phycomyces blakesleeanus NRRL 1555(-)]|uniref:MULE transposase domain-containing protein n=1 Tax=Phycomyces blakesleeanus (strain ATCC 8743b / DSM 1359 / FGSC 10004 / NBRC 33097 / NRRL 1555) TaxID=763407 RepID=A0A162TQV0_PHYB8|nr:hypothetical protein PHYBLDRAFT_60246 [Phycomyces blakesleeanus NRRL 1555(-)]OAD70342.1 hypothetical protein PHYBLDRAFT_60246 [Phycomyces blakesleeanus NRRL 1555(-)]|eukprot:XP_018288382.1 hypothetical protein PHYBLDRAFT_60246 [Phycomyces blakesleeanus NRRL 1555(-)]